MEDAPSEPVTRRPPPDVPPLIHVTSCGLTECNGEYNFRDMFNDRPRYKHQYHNFWIRFTGIWYICDGPDVERAKKFYYYTNFKTKNCVNMEWQCELDGKRPTPCVSQFANGEVIETKVLGAQEDLWVFASITKMHRDGTVDLFVLNHQKHRVHPEALIVDPKLCRKRRPKDTKDVTETVHDIFLCFGFENDADVARITYSKKTNAKEVRDLLCERFNKDASKIHLIKNGKKLRDEHPLKDKDKVIVVIGSGGNFEWMGSR